MITMREWNKLHFFKAVSLLLLTVRICNKKWALKNDTARWRPRELMNKDIVTLEGRVEKLSGTQHTTSAALEIDSGIFGLSLLLHPAPLPPQIECFQK